MCECDKISPEAWSSVVAESVNAGEESARVEGLATSQGNRSSAFYRNRNLKKEKNKLMMMMDDDDDDDNINNNNNDDDNNNNNNNIIIHTHTHRHHRLAALARR